MYIRVEILRKENYESAKSGHLCPHGPSEERDRLGITQALEDGLSKDFDLIVFIYYNSGPGKRYLPICRDGTKHNRDNDSAKRTSSPRRLLRLQHTRQGILQMQFPLHQSRSQDREVY